MATTHDWAIDAAHDSYSTVFEFDPPDGRKVNAVYSVDAEGNPNASITFYEQRPGDFRCTCLDTYNRYRISVRRRDLPAPRGQSDLRVVCEPYAQPHVGFVRRWLNLVSTLAEARAAS